MTGAEPDRVPSLAAELAGLVLPSPVMAAAGCVGTGRELARFLDLGGLGALVTRTVTLDPVAGSPPPRIVETASGLLYDNGRQNPGAATFLATELPWLVQQGVRVVVSIAGSTLADCAELAGRVGAAPGVAGLEVNLTGVSEPAAGSRQVAKVVGVVRREAPRGVAVLAKLSPAGGSVDARAAMEAGADALVVGHGARGLMIDPVRLQPALSAGGGLLSGPAAFPLALHTVWSLHAALPGVPLVGGGGIRTGYDALAMILAGASAVQVGTAILHDPGAPVRIRAELEAELATRGHAMLSELVGLAHREEGESP